jgi:hypothetical protein
MSTVLRRQQMAKKPKRGKKQAMNAEQPKKKSRK